MNPFAALIDPRRCLPTLSGRIAKKKVICPKYVEACAETPWDLTAAEARVMRELTKVGSNKEIARRLGLAVKTVELCLAQALRKMGEDNRVLGALKWDRVMNGSD